MIDRSSYCHIVRVPLNRISHTVYVFALIARYLHVMCGLSAGPAWKWCGPPVGPWTAPGRCTASIWRRRTWGNGSVPSRSSCCPRESASHPGCIAALILWGRRGNGDIWDKRPQFSACFDICFACGARTVPCHTGGYVTVCVLQVAPRPAYFAYLVHSKLLTRKWPSHQSLVHRTGQRKGHNCSWLCCLYLLCTLLEKCLQTFWQIYVTLAFCDLGILWPWHLSNQYLHAMRCQLHTILLILAIMPWKYLTCWRLRDDMPRLDHRGWKLALHGLKSNLDIFSCWKKAQEEVKHLEEEMGELASHAEKRVADLVPLLTSDLVIVCWECDPTARQMAKDGMLVALVAIDPSANCFFLRFFLFSGIVGLVVRRSSETCTSLPQHNLHQKVYSGGPSCGCIKKQSSFDVDFPILDHQFLVLVYPISRMS